MSDKPSARLLEIQRLLDAGGLSPRAVFELDRELTDFQSQKIADMLYLVNLRPRVRELALKQEGALKAVAAIANLSTAVLAAANGESIEALPQHGLSAAKLSRREVHAIEGSIKIGSLSISSDYRSVIRAGQTYRFTEPQGKIIKAFLERAQVGELVLQQKKVLKMAGLWKDRGTNTLAQTFRSRPKFKDIIECVEPGFYRLNQ